MTDENTEINQPADDSFDGMLDSMFSGEEAAKPEPKAEPQEATEEAKPTTEKGEEVPGTPATDKELEETVKQEDLSPQDQGVFKGYLAEKKKRQQAQEAAKKREEELQAEIDRLKNASAEEVEPEANEPAPSQDNGLLKVKMDLSLAGLRREIGKDKADELIQKWIAVSDGNGDLIAEMNSSPDPAYFAKEYLENMDKMAERNKYATEEEYIEAKVQERLAALQGSKPQTNSEPQPTPNITGLGGGDGNSYEQDGQMSGNAELSDLLNTKF